MLYNYSSTSTFVNNTKFYLCSSISVMSDPLWPFGLWSARLLCPWYSPGKNTGVVAISSSRGPSRPRYQTCVSCVFCIASGFFTIEPLPRHFCQFLDIVIAWMEKTMATHSSTLAWRIPWTEDPGGLQSMGSWRVRHDWATSLSLFIFMHWRRKWQPTPVFLPGEFQGWRSLVGCRLWGHTELDTTEATSQQQQHSLNNLDISEDLHYEKISVIKCNKAFTSSVIKNYCLGPSLVVQWLRLCSQCRGHSLSPSSGNWNPTCHTMWPNRKALFVLNSFLLVWVFVVLKFLWQSYACTSLQVLSWVIKDRKLFLK